MNLNVSRSLALLVLVGSAAWAGQLKVKTLGTKSQDVMMCPDCKDKSACAKVGDYTIAFDADLGNPKSGAAKLIVHLKDAAGNPVANAKVAVTLSMPKHGHEKKKPIALKAAGHGKYEAETQLTMSGGYQADVEVTPVSGDKVKQAFAFSR